MAHLQGARRHRNRATRSQPSSLLAGVTPEGAAITCNRVTMDSALARQELGYRPSTLQEMVADCVAWMRADGLLKS